MSKVPQSTILSIKYHFFFNQTIWQLTVRAFQNTFTFDRYHFNFTSNMHVSLDYSISPHKKGYFTYFVKTNTTFFCVKRNKPELTTYTIIGPWSETLRRLHSCHHISMKIVWTKLWHHHFTLITYQLWCQNCRIVHRIQNLCSDANKMLGSMQCFFFMILNTLLIIYQYTLLFQPYLSKIKTSKKLMSAYVEGWLKGTSIKLLILVHFWRSIQKKGPSGWMKDLQQTVGFFIHLGRTGKGNLCKGSLKERRTVHSPFYIALTFSPILEFTNDIRFGMSSK